MKNTQVRNIIEKSGPLIAVILLCIFLAISTDTFMTIDNWMNLFRQTAINAMIAMTDIAEREAAAEMLLEAKGFTDVVVSITDGNADVVLNMGEVTDAKRAQIEDIVIRKTGVGAESIVISTVNAN